MVNVPFYRMRENQTTYSRHSATTFAAVAGLLYLTAYFVFSMFFLRERFMIDGAYMIFEMVNSGSYPSAQNRYIIWLLDILPILSIKMGLPLKTVMISWVLNFTLFYAACFYFILYVIRSRSYAWFLLFTQLLVMVGSFYNISNEISPSAAMAVLLLAVVNREPDIRTSIRSIVIGLCLFFTVFGHLLVPVGLLFAGAYNFLVNKEHRNRLRRSYLWAGSLFAILFALRIYLGMGDQYERNNMSVGLGSLSNLTSIFNWSFIGDFLYFYVKSFAPVGIILIFLIHRFVVEKLYTRLITLTLILAAFFVIWHITITSLYPDYGLSIYFDVHTRWLFPFNFIILFSLVEYADRSKVGLFRLRPMLFWLFLAIQFYILRDYSNWDPTAFRVLTIVFIVADLLFLASLRLMEENIPVLRRWHLGHLFILIAVYQFSVWYRISDYPRNNVRQFEALELLAREQTGSKFFVANDMKCNESTYHIVNTNSIVFSAMKGPELTKQIIFASDEDLNILRESPEQVLFMAPFVELGMQELNTRYFKMEEGRYRKLDADFRDCTF